MRDCLPSERVLATQYGVSRNVIREAIKILTENRDMDAYKKTIHLHLKLIRQLLQ